MSVEHSSVQIRPVREEDRQAVMDLASLLREGVPEWRDPEAVVEAARQWLAGHFAPERDQPGAAFVAEAEGEVAGVVSVSTQRHFTGPMEAYIGELAVAPHAARTGLGRRLLSAAEDWARQQGVSHMTLETAAGNTTARRFYAAAGYREEAIRFTRALDQPA
ncbi:GNAT family N-acetyltransferase [Nonomuraea fuscirosea]|uniref:GNAT family N-acetyltransferase n=1 Tax=Nonomuraea fuscirosea TaxID=1291556 RepID=UPI0034438513